MANALSRLGATIMDYVPSDSTRVDIVSGAYEGVCTGLLSYSLRTFFTLSVPLMHSAYPSTPVRIAFAACAIFWKSAQKGMCVGDSKDLNNRINRFVQKYTCVILILELAHSILYPASTAGRIVVQTAVIAASAVSHANVIKDAFHAFGLVIQAHKSRNKKPVDLSTRMKDLVGGLTLVGLGIYGGMQVYHIARRL